jgi:hypothetical protein
VKRERNRKIRELRKEKGGHRRSYPILFLTFPIFLFLSLS